MQHIGQHTHTHARARAKIMHVMFEQPMCTFWPLADEAGLRSTVGDVLWITCDKDESDSTGQARKETERDRR